MEELAAHEVRAAVLVSSLSDEAAEAAVVKALLEVEGVELVTIVRDVQYEN